MPDARVVDERNEIDRGVATAACGAAAAAAQATSLKGNLDSLPIALFADYWADDVPRVVKYL